MPPVPASSVWSRRGFLATATASALGLAARPAHATPGPAAAAADEFATLRGRWCELTLGTGFDPAAPPYAAALQETGALASTFQAGMRPAAGSLWPDCRYDPPSGITQSYSRLATMAQAYAQPGTGRTGDPGLAAALVTGLDHLDDHRLPHRHHPLRKLVGVADRQPQTPPRHRRPPRRAPARRRPR